MSGTLGRRHFFEYLNRFPNSVKKRILNKHQIQRKWSFKPGTTIGSSVKQQTSITGRPKVVYNCKIFVDGITAVEHARRRRREPQGSNGAPREHIIYNIIAGKCAGRVGT